MKKISSILYFLLVVVHFAFAQQEAKFSKELKLNMNMRYSAESWQLGPLSPVFTLVTPKHHRHDFELSRLRISGQQDSRRTTAGQGYPMLNSSHAFWARYQYTFSFLPASRFSPNLGGSLESRWSYKSFSILRARPFRFGEWVNHNFLELVPGLRWHISDRIGIDYGIAVPVLQHTFAYGRLRSVAMGDRAYGRYSIVSDPFGSFRSRIGVYVKL